MWVWRKDGRDLTNRIGERRRNPSNGVEWKGEENLWSKPKGLSCFIGLNKVRTCLELNKGLNIDNLSPLTIMKSSSYLDL